MHATERPSISGALERLAGGDDDARDALVDACESRMRALVNRMLSGVPGARQCEDDDQLLAAAATRLRLVFDPGLSAPMHSVIERTAAEIKHLLFEVAMTRLVRDAAPPAGPPPQPRRDESHAARARCMAFLTAVDGLPCCQRQVFHLVWFMGADPEAVSRLTRRSPRTVRRLWREARDAVHEAVNRDARSVAVDDPGRPTNGAAPAA